MSVVCQQILLICILKFSEFIQFNPIIFFRSFRAILQHENRLCRVFFGEFLGRDRLGIVVSLEEVTLPEGITQLDYAAGEAAHSPVGGIYAARVQTDQLSLRGRHRAHR